MGSKAFLLLALAFATVLLVTSEMAAAKDLASGNDSHEVEDAKYGRDDSGYYNGGGRGGYYNGGGRGRHEGGRYCRYGCCGRGRYYNGGGCRCCSTYAEATAYKQTHVAQAHN